MSLPSDFVFSQSNLHSFTTCPRQFYLRYVEKLEWPASWSLDIPKFEMDRQAGINFHQLIHQLILGINSDHLTKLASNDADSRLVHWLESFSSEVLPELKGELLPEYALYIQLEGFTLVAKYDLIEIRPEAINLYDWKTSAKPSCLARLKESLQSKIFSLVYAETQIEQAVDFDPNKLNMIYWEANQPTQLMKFAYSTGQWQKDRTEVLALIQKIQAAPVEAFTQTTNLKYCQFCQYTSFCGRTNLIKKNKCLVESISYDVLLESFERIPLENEFKLDI